MEELVKELKGFQKRKKRKEKTKFIHYLKEKLKDYEIKVNEKDRVRNVETVSENLKITFMAHYDTGSKMPLIQRLFSWLFGISIGESLDFVIIAILVFLPIPDGIITGILILIFLDIIIWKLISNQNNMNDNTSGVLLLLSLAERLKSTSYKNQIRFIFADGEKLYKVKKQLVHESNEVLKNQIILNFDSIGQGSTLFLLSGYNLLKKIDFNNEVKERLESAFKSHLNQVKVAESINKVFSEYCSFYIGVYKKSLTKIGYYIPHNHTYFDRNIDLETIQSIENSVLDFLNIHFNEEEHL